MILNRKSLTGSALGLLAILFVAVAMLSNLLFRGMRLDLTENALYTISPGTRQILGKLEEPLHLTLYFSNKATAESNRTDVRNLRLYFDRVHELLEEIKSLSNGKIRLDVVDPIPYSEAEDRATAAGLQGIPVGPAGEKIFLGLAGTNSTTGEAAIPFFEPGKEAFLEYDIAKLIHDLAISQKPKIAILSGLPINGGFDQQTMQMTEEWASYQQLAQLFDVSHVEAGSLKTIAPEINEMIIVHPKQLNEDAEYAIDQFLMRGGHLLIFVDPFAEKDTSGTDPGNPLAGMMSSKSSDLPLLFKAWGVDYAADKVVLDGDHAMMVNLSAGAGPMRHPGILHFGKEDLPQDDVVTANLESLNLASAGHFTLNKESQLKLVPLLQSSARSMLKPADQFKFSKDASTLWSGFAASGERYVLAARLQGKFKTAFPQRNEAGHLAEAKDTGEIVLVADTDMLANWLWVRVQNFFGQKLLDSFADNGNFFINAADNLSGTSDLISIRGRGTSVRPFTRVESLKMAADDRFRMKEEELEQELRETENKLVALQNSKSNDQKQILNPAQKQELENFLDRKLEIRKELREVRRQLDAEIDRLGAWLKFINIALLPLLITIGSLVFLGWRAKRKDV